MYIAFGISRLFTAQKREEVEICINFIHVNSIQESLDTSFQKDFSNMTLESRNLQSIETETASDSLHYLKG